eukprot:120770_1
MFGILHDAGFTLFDLQFDDCSCFMLTIRSFDINSNKKKVIIADVLMKGGNIISNSILLKSANPVEFWISAAKGYEQQLRRIGWLDSSELKKWRLPCSINESIYVGDRVWFAPFINCECNRTNGCNKCNRSPKVITGHVLGIESPTYRGEMTPSV